MSGIVGPSTWWLKSKEAADYYARICPVGTVLGDGSAVWCREGGRAWIAAPRYTQIGSQWAGNNYTGVCATNEGKTICCICEWPALYSELVSYGFNPCDWFVPSYSILFTSYLCYSNWSPNFTTYWSSTEATAFIGENLNMTNGTQPARDKPNFYCVAAFRCITL